MVTASAVRRANARDCLLALRDAEQPLTLAELAARTNLSRPTIDAVLTDLGPVVAPAPATASGTAGRPARRVAFDPSAATFAALDLGARRTRCLVTDAAGHPLALTEESADVPLPEVVARTGHSPGAVGIAVPGIMHPDGTVARSIVLPTLQGRDLAAEFAVPALVENDIKLAALAEHHRGEAADSLVLVQIGHRISVAVVLEGQILQGAHRLAGELGSQRGMRWTATSERGRLTWSTGDEAQPLLEAAARGDTAAQQEIAEFCAQIAPRLATVLLTVDPDRLVIGGGLSCAGETLLRPLREALARLLVTDRAPEVVAARLTADGALVGALNSAYTQFSEHTLGVRDLPAPWSEGITA